MQRERSSLGLTATAAHPWQGIAQWLEHYRVMPIGARDAKDQRDALAVRGDVALADELAPVRKVGAGVSVPRGIAALAAPMLTRLKSRLKEPMQLVDQQKMRAMPHAHCLPVTRASPAGHAAAGAPSLKKILSPGMPVRSTHGMRLQAISSLTRKRLPLPKATATGNSGAMLMNSAVLLSLF